MKQENPVKSMCLGVSQTPNTKTDWERNNVPVKYDEKLKKLISEIESPALMDDRILDEVTFAGAKVIWGDSTPEQAAKEAADKLELYLGE